MGYKRRRKTSRGRVSKRRRGRPSNRQIARVIMAKSEPKRYIFDKQINDLSYNGNLTSMTSSIMQGTDTDERIGNRINIKGIAVRAWFRNLDSTTAAPVVFRIMVVKQKGDALSVASFPYGTYMDYLTPMDQDRGIVLYDKTVVVQGYGAGAASGYRCIKKYFPMKGRKVKFDSGTVSAVESGDVYVYVWSNENSATYGRVYLRMVNYYKDF